MRATAPCTGNSRMLGTYISWFCSEHHKLSTTAVMGVTCNAEFIFIHIPTLSISAYAFIFSSQAAHPLPESVSLQLCASTHKSLKYFVSECNCISGK